MASVYLLVAGVIWYAQAKILFHPSRIVDVTPGDLGLKFNNVTLPLKGDQFAGWWVPAEDQQARTLHRRSWRGGSMPRRPNENSWL